MNKEIFIAVCDRLKTEVPGAPVDRCRGGTT